MFKKIISLTTALLLTLSMVACNGGQSASKPADATNSTAASEGAIKVTFITTASGLGDRSFNDSTWAGVQKAQQELGVEISVIEPASVSDYGSSVMAAVNSGANLILGFGGVWGDVFNDYCHKFPEVYFAGLNAKSEFNNLLIAQTADHQGSFLVGALAAMMTQTGTVGAVGGQDADNINRFLVGYEEGARYVNPDVTVLKSYVGSYSDPAKGKEFSGQLANQGADIIYQVAGGTGEGVFEAAKENEKMFAIGVDSDQDYIVEGKVLTSMMKNCDTIAYDIIQMVLNDQFESGYKTYDLSNGGVGMSPMTYSKDLVGAENIKRLEEISKKIISGEIVVTDIFEK